MAKITRYQGDLEGFSSSAVGQERVVFGDTGATQSDDLTANINSDFLRGWGALPLGNKPPREWFNSVHWVSTQLSAYLHQMGIAEWHVAQEYHKGSFCVQDGAVMVSVSDNNTGNSLDDTSHWMHYGVTISQTFADLSSLNPTVAGQAFECVERANAKYVLKPSGYTAIDGDVTFANGRVAELQLIGDANVAWFGSINLANITSAVSRFGGAEIPKGTWALPSLPPEINSLKGEGLLDIGGQSIHAGNITSAITLLVPSVFSSIPDAIKYLRDRQIEEGGSVTIQVADGNYSHTGFIDISLPQGSLVQILGNTTTPASCEFTFTDGGFICSNAPLSMIDGFSITSTNWTSHGVWNGSPETAIAAVEGAAVRAGSNMLINKCYYGLRADNANITVSGGGFPITESGDAGVLAFGGGKVECVGASMNVSLSSDAANSLGYGYVAEQGGAVWADNAVANNNDLSGFFANANGGVRCNGSQATNNGRHGMEANRDSYIEAINATSNNNTNAGYFALDNSFIDATNSAATGNNNNYQAEDGGNVNASGASSNTAVSNGFLAFFRGGIKAIGSSDTGSATGYSPTLNTEGNTLSYIRG